MWKDWKKSFLKKINEYIDQRHNDKNVAKSSVDIRNSKVSHEQTSHSNLSYHVIMKIIHRIT